MRIIHRCSMNGFLRDHEPGVFVLLGSNPHIQHQFQHWQNSQRQYQLLWQKSTEIGGSQIAFMSLFWTFHPGQWSRRWTDKINKKIINSNYLRLDGHTVQMQTLWVQVFCGCSTIHYDQLRRCEGNYVRLVLYGHQLPVCWCRCPGHMGRSNCRLGLITMLGAGEQ